MPISVLSISALIATQMKTHVDVVPKDQAQKIGDTAQRQNQTLCHANFLVYCVPNAGHAIQRYIILNLPAV